MLEQSLTEDEARGIGTHVKSTAHKNQDMRGMFHNRAAQLAIIKALKLNEQTIVSKSLMIGDKWAGVKFSNADSDEILIPLRNISDDYTIFVRDGVEPLTYEICGYFTSAVISNAEIIDTRYGERYLLFVENLSPIEDLENIVSSYISPSPAPKEKAEEKWTSAVKYLSDNKDIVKPKKRRTIDPKAMEITSKFVNDSGVPIDAEMYARKAGISRDLAQERLNSAKVKGLIKLHPLCNLKKRWYLSCQA